VFAIQTGKRRCSFSQLGKYIHLIRQRKSVRFNPFILPMLRVTIEVFRTYAAGLKDIETFSHIYIIYLFDRAGDVQLIRPTFLDDEPHGIYASRHPCRPNSIGMSIVRLEKRNDNILVVRGVDVLDGTPLLDIKPYIPKFDIIESASDGWVGGMQWRSKPSNRE
jgi:tRNA-Thr(GGU) m(6)t(6)A37 methyltransferase TsaA